MLLASCQKVSVPRVSSKVGDVSEFAKTFTTHYLDNNYQTYESSQTALKQEASPGLLQALQKSGAVPKSDKDVKAKAQVLAKKKQTSSVNVKEVKQGDVDANGLVQVNVQGEITGAGARPFNLTYGIGIRKDNNKLAVVTVSGN